MRVLWSCAALFALGPGLFAHSPQGALEEEGRRAKLVELHSIPKLNLTFYGGVDSKDGTFFVFKANRHQYDNRKVDRLFLRGERLRGITETPGYAQGDPASALAFITALRDARQPYQFYLDSVRSDLITRLEEELGEGQAAVDFYQFADLVGVKDGAVEVLLDSLDKEGQWKAHAFLASVLLDANKALVKQRLDIGEGLPGKNGGVTAVFTGTYDPEDAIQTVRFEAEVFRASLELLKQVKLEHRGDPEVSAAAKRAGVISANNFVTKRLVGLLIEVVGAQDNETIFSGSATESGQGAGSALAMLREVRASTERAGDEWGAVLLEAREASAATYLTAFMIALEVSRWAEEDPEGTAAFFNELGEQLAPWVNELIEALFDDGETPGAAKERFRELWLGGPGESFIEWREEFRSRLSDRAIVDAAQLLGAPPREDEGPGAAALRLVTSLLLDERWEETVDYFGSFGGGSSQELSGALRAVEEFAFSVFRENWFERISSEDPERGKGLSQVSLQLSSLERELEEAGLGGSPLVRTVLAIARTGLMEVFRYGQFGDEATLQAEALAKEYPHFLEAWLTLAEVQATRTEADLSGASYALERARELSPEEPELIETEGLILALGGDWEGALRCYRRAEGQPNIHHARAEVCTELAQAADTDEAAAKLMLEAKREHLVAYTLYLDWLAAEDTDPSKTGRRWITMVSGFVEDCLKGFTADWEELGEGLEQRLFKVRALEVLQAGPHASTNASFLISEYKGLLAPSAESRGPIEARAAVGYGEMAFAQAERFMRMGVPRDLSPEEVQERGRVVRFLLTEAVETLSSTAQVEDGGGPTSPAALDATVALLDIFSAVGDTEREDSTRLLASQLFETTVGYDVQGVALSCANIGASLRARGEHGRCIYYFREAFGLSLRALGERHRLTSSLAVATLEPLRRGVLMGTMEFEELEAFAGEVPEGVKLIPGATPSLQGALSAQEREELRGLVERLFREHILLGSVLESLDQESALSEIQREEAEWLAQLRGNPAAADLNELAWPLVDPEQERQGADLEYALRVARAAVALSPMDPGVRDTLAWALFANDRFEEALAEGRRALELAGEERSVEFQGYLRALQERVAEVGRPADEEG